MVPRSASGAVAVSYGVMATATVLSVLLSIISLIIAVQAKQAAQPALAYDFPAATRIHTKTCADPTLGNANLTELNVEYVVTISNTGGRSINLLHTMLQSGTKNDLPWSVALTEGPTSLGTIVDAGQAATVSMPTNILSGQSRRIVVNGRVRLDQTNTAQAALLNEITTSNKLQLTLVFSDNSRRTAAVAYALQDDNAANQTPTCAHGGDFFYHIDQQ